LIKYKIFHAFLDIKDSAEKQQDILDELTERIENFKIDNPIRVEALTQSESLNKTKCHITIMIDYIFNEDIKRMEILN